MLIKNKTICICVLLLYFAKVSAQNKDTCLWCFPHPATVFIDSIPNDLKSVKYLRLKRKFYKPNDIPLERLENLEYFDVSNCYFYDIKSLIDKLAYLPKLKYLNLDLPSGFIDTLSFKKGTFKSLEYLSVAQCGLEFIDSSIGELSNLKYLNLGIRTSDMQIPNRIKELPLSMQKLHLLKTLVYADNDVQDFPEVICELSSLENLNIRGNQLKFIPQCITQLKNLQVLDIGYNLLDFLPSYIAVLENLKHLNINGNNIKLVPVELMKYIK